MLPGLKELENTDISSVEQAISDIQGQLDAQADAQAREDIVNSSGILTNVQTVRLLQEV